MQICIGYIHLFMAMDYWSDIQYFSIDYSKLYYWIGIQCSSLDYYGVDYGWIYSVLAWISLGWTIGYVYSIDTFVCHICTLKQCMDIQYSISIIPSWTTVLIYRMAVDILWITRLYTVDNLLVSCGYLVDNFVDPVDILWISTPPTPPFDTVWMYRPTTSLFFKF